MQKDLKKLGAPGARTAYTARLRAEKSAVTGRLLAQTAMKQGLEVTFMPAYGALVSNDEIFLACQSSCH